MNWPCSLLGSAHAPNRLKPGLRTPRAGFSARADPTIAAVRSPGFSRSAACVCSQKTLPMVAVLRCAPDTGQCERALATEAKKKGHFCGDSV